MTLTARQELFAVEYLKDLNATQAAVRAGYSKDTARSIGSENLTKPDIVAAISDAAAKRNQHVEVSANMVLRELLALATVDIAAAFDETGALKPIHEIPVDVRKAIAGVDVFEEFAGRGEQRERIGETKKVKFWDRPRALEMLGRHIQLFKDSLALTGPAGGPIQIDDFTRVARINAIYEAVARRRDTGEDLV